MTCGACVSKVEKQLARLDGVSASVNLATNRAQVVHPGSVSVEELVSTVEQAGFGASPVEPVMADEPAADAVGESAAASHPERHRLLVTLALALPVLALSMIPALQFRHWQWLCFALTSPVAVWSARPFHAKALRGLRYSSSTMDTLVSLGVVASFAWSTYALFLGGAGEPGMRMDFSLLPSTAGTADMYLEGTVTVPLFVLTGRYLEARAKHGTGAALRALAELAVKKVNVEVKGQERLCPIGELRVGDVFVTRPGERLATDGVVVSGRSALDVSLVTGESEPVEVGPGDRVVGASVNCGGMLRVSATAVGADTQLARITRLVTDAQTGKARVQRLADRVSGVFVPCVLVLAVTVLGFWLGAGARPHAAISAAVAVLVVACPCALGLAVPAALLTATGRGAQLGVLISGPRALETLRRIDTVVLDKTGTLTTGRMTVAHVTTTPDGLGERAALRLAAAAEMGSEHPVGRAIVAYVREEPPVGQGYGDLPEATDFRARPGVGVSARVDGHDVDLRSPEGELPDVLVRAQKHAERAALTPVVLYVDKAPEALFGLGDTLRPDAYRAVGQLRAMGLRPVLASGDRPAAVRAIADELGITDVHAACSPQDKADLVRRLEAEGRHVAMIGDGVNDAPALAGAELGIAMGSGTDAAIGAADLTVVRQDVAGVAEAVQLARATLRTIRVNLVWAFGYNLVTLPLAATGRLTPMLAAAAMSVSSVLVVCNSLRLRTWNPRTAGGRRMRHNTPAYGPGSVTATGSGEGTSVPAQAADRAKETA
ncbi:heavy metal translocating P-type ATPase [Streptomyces sp. NPDC058200]|uniref:heavy metal translocating P-type ATPase n=1 Tax=Streptomyces sp. NPDC058200 TaxID=3346378 RepID=UPI0036E2CA66